MSLTGSSLHRIYFPIIGKDFLEEILLDPKPMYRLAIIHLLCYQPDLLASQSLLEIGGVFDLGPIRIIFFMRNGYSFLDERRIFRLVLMTDEVIDHWLLSGISYVIDNGFW